MVGYHRYANHTMDDLSYNNLFREDRLELQGLYDCNWLGLRVQPYNYRWFRIVDHLVFQVSVDCLEISDHQVFCYK